MGGKKDFFYWTTVGCTDSFPDEYNPKGEPVWVCGCWGYNCGYQYTRESMSGDTQTESCTTHGKEPWGRDGDDVCRSKLIASRKKLFPKYQQKVNSHLSALKKQIDDLNAFAKLKVSGNCNLQGSED